MRTGLALLVMAASFLQIGCSNYATVTQRRPGFHPLQNTVGALVAVNKGIAKALTLSAKAPKEAMGDLLDSAAAAERQLLLNPKDDEARDAYNFAIARVFSIILDSKLDPWAEPLTVPAEGGSYILTNKKDPRELYNPSNYTLTPADQFDVKGTYVTVKERKPGVGAPLVAVGRQESTNAKKDFALPRTYYGITAVAHFKGRRCEISFEDPLSTETVTLQGKTFPLAADFTVPLAVMLASTNPKKLELARLLSPEKYAETAHIKRLQPYDPNKTVVLVVHGLMDSPATWAPMLNTLRADETIRKNYQFWFYSYPSGYPYPYSASILRKELDAIEQKYKLNKKMVLIGHSMGGCISRLMITDSGQELWNTFFSKPPAETKMSAQSKEFYQDALIFKHRPEVGRVIFIAAPLRGADMAAGWIGKIGAKLVKAPAKLLKVGSETMTMVSLGGAGAPAKRLPNSVDTMSSNNRFVKAVSKLPLAPGIAYHSIMGDRGKGGNKDHTKPVHSDGLVPYWSSHLDGAQSELIVPSGHTAHQNAEAMAEVRRILRDNAGR